VLKILSDIYIYIYHFVCMEYKLPFEDVKLAMGPYRRLYQKYWLLLFSLTAQLREQDVFGDDWMHLEAAQTQILCSYYTCFGHVIDTRM